MSPSDGELIRQATNGDRVALTTLLENHAGSLRERFRHEIPKRWQSVLSLDDLLQETFTDAFLDIMDFSPRGQGSFEQWLGTIAKHNLLNALEMLEADKRGGDRQRVETDRVEGSYVALYELLGATSTTPSRVAARVESRDALNKAIERLPEDYRRVVAMYDLEGCSVQDVATLLGRSTGSVFMLRARAHKALRKLLGRASGFLSDSA